ncbi:hypothetical protein BOX15_Mlig033780g1, partial [Macrostomum lignano]
PPVTAVRSRELLNMSSGSWMRPLALFASALPAAALLACVCIAVHYRGEGALATHCRNVNRLPSISAAVGQRSLEKRIWSVSIAVSCALRLLVAAAYRQEIAARLSATWRVSDSCGAASLIPGAHFGLGCLELASLLGLSVIASTDNYAVHRNCFITFLLSSFAYMLLHLWVASRIRSKFIAGTQRVLFTTRCFLAKLLLLSAYCASILLAVYFYARHQAYCEDMMYTYFAVAEYAVVYANILFHFTAYYDLGSLPICLVLTREFKLPSCKTASGPGNCRYWGFLWLSHSCQHQRRTGYDSLDFAAEQPVSAVTHSIFVGL